MDRHTGSRISGVKKAIANTTTLKYFNPEEAVVVQCAASETGLRATLMQGKPFFTFASRVLTPPEQGYAQIERELLAVVFGINTFHQHTYERHAVVH